MVSRLFSGLVVHPLRVLYFHGPTALGFWGGSALPDICYTLTSTPSQFWHEHTDECVHLVERKFDAFRVAVTFSVYVLVLLRLFDALVLHACFTRPLLHELRARALPTLCSKTPVRHAATTGADTHHAARCPAQSPTSTSTAASTANCTAKSREYGESVSK